MEQSPLSKVERLLEILQSLGALVEELKEENSILRKELEETQKRVEELEASRNRIRERLKALIARIEEIETSILKKEKGFGREDLQV